MTGAPGPPQATSEEPQPVAFAAWVSWANLEVSGRPGSGRHAPGCSLCRGPRPKGSFVRGTQWPAGKRKGHVGGILAKENEQPTLAKSNGCVFGKSVDCPAFALCAAPASREQ